MEILLILYVMDIHVHCVKLCHISRGRNMKNPVSGPQNKLHWYSVSPANVKMFWTHPQNIVPDDDYGN